MNLVPASEHLRTLYGITDDVFNNIQAEVTACMKTLLPPEVKDVLSTKAAFILSSSILDDLLNEINVTLLEVFDHTSPLHSSPLIANVSRRIAEKLPLYIATKMQEFLHLCFISGWLSASRGSNVNIHEVLEDRLSHVTARAVRAVFDRMLSICSVGTSADFQKVGSAIYSFLHDVADNIKTEGSPEAATPKVSPSATGTDMTGEPPSAVHPQADGAKQEDNPVNVPSVDDVPEYRSVLHMMFLFWLSQAYRNARILCANMTEIAVEEAQMPNDWPADLQEKDTKETETADPEELAQILKSICSQAPEFHCPREDSSPPDLHELANLLNGMIVHTARREPVPWQDQAPSDPVKISLKVTGEVKRPICLPVPLKLKNRESAIDPEELAQIVKSVAAQSLNFCMIQPFSYSRVTETDAAEKPSKQCFPGESFKTGRVPKAGVFTQWQNNGVQNDAKENHHWDRTLETVVFNCTSGSPKQFRLLCEDFQSEASELLSNIIINEALEIIMSEATEEQNSSMDLRTTPAVSSRLESCSLAASSGVVNLLTSELQSFFDMTELADPSVDPVLYKAQVELVTEKILKSTRAQIREILVTDLLMIFEAMTPGNGNDDLNKSLLSGSETVVRSIVRSIKDALSHSVVRDVWGSARREFLECLEENLDLLFFPKTSTEQDPQLPKTRFRPFKTLKLRFKKWTSRVEPVTVLPEETAQEKMSPTGPKVKRKNRVQAFFRRAWQAVKNTVICGNFTKISPSN